MQFFPPEQYGRIGYFPLQYDGTNCSQNFIRIYADIPTNFTVVSAYITLRHQPVTWNYYSSTAATSTTNTVGSARNVQIYTDSLNARETINVESELQSITSTPGTATNKLGENGKTFGNSQIETVTSEELKEYLKPRKPYSIQYRIFHSSKQHKDACRCLCKNWKCDSYIKCFRFSEG